MKDIAFHQKRLYFDTVSSKVGAGILHAGSLHIIDKLLNALRDSLAEDGESLDLEKWDKKDYDVVDLAGSVIVAEKIPELLDLGAKFKDAIFSIIPMPIAARNFATARAIYTALAPDLGADAVKVMSWVDVAEATLKAGVQLDSYRGSY